PSQPNSTTGFAGQYHYFVQYRATLTTVDKQVTPILKSFRVEFLKRGEGLATDTNEFVGAPIYPGVSNSWPGWYTTPPAYTASAAEWNEVKITLINDNNKPGGEEFTFAAGTKIPVITTEAPAAALANFKFIEGTNSVATWAKDLSGNSQPGETIEICYDKTPPGKPEIILESASKYDSENNAYYVNAPKVNFKVKVESLDKRARRVIVSNKTADLNTHPSDSSKWNEMTDASQADYLMHSVTDYPLTEGLNIIYVKCSDQAGNLSNINYMRIYLDSTKPKSYNDRIIHSSKEDFTLPGHDSDGIIILDDKLMMSKWMYNKDCALENGNTPVYVSADSKYLYVCDASNVGIIGKFLDGKLKTTKNTFLMPGGTVSVILKSPVAFIPFNDKLFILDKELHVLFRVALNKNAAAASIIGDTIEAMFGVVNSPSSAPQCLNGPMSMAIFGTEEIYVADTGNNRVFKTNINLTNITAQYGSVFASPIKEPVSVSADYANVYIAEKGLDGVHKVVQLDKNLNVFQYFTTASAGNLMGDIRSVTSDGNYLYVAHKTSDMRVSKFLINPIIRYLTFVKEFVIDETPVPLNDIRSIYADGEDVYFIDVGSKKIIKTSSALWKYKGQFGKTGMSGTAIEERLYEPTALASDDSNIFVLSRHVTNKGVVYKLNNNLKYLSENKNYEMSNPKGIALTKNCVYVVNSSGSAKRILLIWSKDFNIQYTYDNSVFLPSLVQPYDICSYFDGSKYQLYIADYNSQTIYKYEEKTDGQLIRTGQSMLFDKKPIAVAADASGVYVLLNNHTIVKLELDLQSVKTYYGREIRFGVPDSPDKDDSHLNISDISKMFSTGNQVYVSDTNNHRVIKLDPYLNYKGEYGESGVLGIDDTHFNKPSGITVFSGDIYVNDFVNHRMVKTGNNVGVYTSAWANMGSHIDKLKILSYKGDIPLGSG
ncbi:MAG TPA: hypothetical protein PKL57_14045, partial [Candidatus Wallbacteria bacterium]|nr:hypothetical protein [Candidatus Wallbacteria bacterium]